MLVSLPFRRFVQQLTGVLSRRRVSIRRRSRGSESWASMSAMVETLEPRVLLSSIVVNSTDGGQNYASTVTVGQLDPTHTAVTLRDAINAANNTGGADSISFDPTVFPPSASTPTTIVLSGGTPLELKDTSGATTIAGPGAGQVTVSGNNLSTVFVIDTGVTAEIDGLTITGGKASVSFGASLAGGGIYNAGTLTLQEDVITANSAAVYGGGLFNSGTVTVTGSTFSHDTAQFGGGFFNTGRVSIAESTLAANSASSNGGGFYSQGTVNVTDSTLSSNSAGVNGGGFYSNNTVNLTNSTLALNSAQTGGGFYNVRTVTVTDSTIAQNFAQSGGGVYNSFGNVTLQGTIVARNAVSPTNSAPRDWAGSIASAASSYNLVGDGTNTGLTDGVNHNIVGTSASPVDPLLAPLGDYGGPTQTMALLPGSLALDAGANFNNPVTGSLIAADQRGVVRPQGAAPDIGAYESAGFALAVKGGDNQSAVVNTSFAAPLAVQLTEKAFGKVLPDAGLTITFAAPSGPGATLGGNPAATDASGTARVTAVADGTVGAYTVTASAAGVDSATFHLTNLEAPSLVVNTAQDVVNNTDGVTSLREAIAYANTFTTAATITFDATVFPAGSLTTITLGGTALELKNTAAPITIAGPGAGQVAVSGGNLSMVFIVDARVTAAIDGLTITGGKGNLGGGLSNAGTLD
ncbi:MAG: choice-of-anchor Q domain-containing protein, partial [Deltaproteobacteria bacterium]